MLDSHSSGGGREWGWAEETGGREEGAGVEIQMVGSHRQNF